MEVFEVGRKRYMRDRTASRNIATFRTNGTIFLTMMLPRCPVWDLGREPLAPVPLPAAGAVVCGWLTSFANLRGLVCFLRVPLLRLGEPLVGSRCRSSCSSAWQIFTGFRTFFSSISRLYPSSGTRSYSDGQHRLILQIDIDGNHIHVSIHPSIGGGIADGLSRVSRTCQRSLFL